MKLFIKRKLRPKSAKGQNITNNSPIELWKQQQEAIERIQLNDNLSSVQKEQQIQACKDLRENIALT